ncbi:MULTISPECIES: DUF1905 domain-containing protein [Dactylosporangium]|uniref:DUF1905 domain-containing protein n=2 Tax=Dactylosporangium TaxID=35753 RepID=A0A9W6KHV4_9ACTN|nr:MULTISPECIES: DUF1905 domain-containing protein [Dactylosporangium]UAC01274.1 DUF1905 domain-containing protein [Dactylosporangium vinaceum]UWZ48830.1 DUF1905 domain-containing protein [Dactylosporangium matsuzakiense]GLL01065.1 hypothetical protein GCM10017581_028060 [Dactylosporangium matsuzakiense]
MIVEFESRLWQWDARQGDSWYFVSLPADRSEEIRELTAGTRRGFGSVRVRAQVGATIWRTSIFPSADGPYVLPMKQAVRKAQHLDRDDLVTATVEILDL